jgi:signal transduction histidine kinase
MGLWTVSILVDRNGGDVSIRTNEPRGSVVSILLPSGDPSKNPDAERPS